MEARRGAGEASQSPALGSSHGNGNEDEREQCRARTGSNWCRTEVRLGDRAGGQSQDRAPLATMEMLRKGGHLNGEERETLVLFLFFFFSV